MRIIRKACISKKDAFKHSLVGLTTMLVVLASHSVGAQSKCTSELVSKQTVSSAPHSPGTSNEVFVQLAHLRTAIAASMDRGETALARTFAKSYKAKLDELKSLGLLDGRLRQESDALDLTAAKRREDVDKQINAVKEQERIYQPWKTLTPFADAKSVTQVEMSPSENKMLTMKSDGSLELVDVENGRKIYQVAPINGTIINTGFSDDGLRFFTVNIDGKAFVHDTKSGGILAKVDLRGVKVFQSALNHDGSLFAANCRSDDGSSQQTLIIDVKSRKKFRIITYDGSFWVAKLEFSPDSRQLLTLLGSGEGLVDDLHSNKRLKFLEDAERMSFLDGVKYSPNGSQVLASGKKTGVLTLFDAKNGKILHRLVGHSDKINTIRFSSDGKRALTASKDRTAILWDIQTGLPLLKFGDHHDAVLSANFIKGSELVVTAAMDNIVSIWSLTSGQKISSLSGPAIKIDWLTFPNAGVSHDGKLIFINFPSNGPTFWKQDSTQAEAK